MMTADDSTAPQTAAQDSHSGTPSQTQTSRQADDGGRPSRQEHPKRHNKYNSLRYNTWLRLVCCAAAGLAVGLLSLLVVPFVAPMIGWIVTAGSLALWTWLDITWLDPEQTKEHAGREDPGRAVVDALILLGALASLVGIGLMLVATGAKDQNTVWGALIGVASLVASWFLVHVLFVLRYAREYYTDPIPRPISFNNDEDAAYVDIAYMTFSLAMTYQVSDTDIKSRRIRRTALRHSLLSYLLGAVFIATTVNLVIQLVSG